MPGELTVIKPRRIFVSYRHIEPDQTVARQVVQALKEQHHVFIDRDIEPGSEWGGDIENALQSAEFLIAILSEAAAKSPMIVAEIETAHQRRMDTGEPQIIPVRLGFDGPLRYPLSAYLNRFQYIFWAGPEDTPGLIQNLLAAIGQRSSRVQEIHTHPRLWTLGRLRNAVRRAQPLDEMLARRNRLQMIKRVRHDWIEGVLYHSLYRVARIDLALMENVGAVATALDLVINRPFEEPRPLTAGTPVSKVFDEQLGQLLILGAPGSGKTTLLLELAEELLARAREDETHPIPILFNLSSWAVHRSSLAHWMLDELNERYDVSRKLAQMWLDQERVLPLLDGLDEITFKKREECVEAINAFRKEHGLVPLVVCSRSEEYQSLTTRLRLPGAVVIQSLTRQQVEEYLNRAGGDLIAVRTALRSDMSLWELFDTPLMLSIAARAYRTVEQGHVPLTGTLIERRHHLFAKYVDTMLQKRGTQSHYRREQTIHWVAWLASSLARHDLSIFSLESLNPEWVRARPGVAPIIVGAVFALGWGLLFGPLVGLFFGSVWALVAWRVLATERQLKAVDAIHFSCAWLPGGLGLGLVVGVGIGLIEGLQEGLINGVRVGVFGGLGVLLLRGLGEGWAELQNVPSGRPNCRTWRSGKSAVIFCLLSVLAFTIAFGFLSILFVGISETMRTVTGNWVLTALVSGLFVGLLGAMTKGGLFFLQHFIVRALLWYKGFAPANYVRFLDYAAERLFLRKVGGGYIFVHRMLMEYFASLEHGSDLST